MKVWVLMTIAFMLMVVGNCQYGYRYGGSRYPRYGNQYTYENNYQYPSYQPTLISSEVPILEEVPKTVEIIIKSEPPEPVEEFSITDQYVESKPHYWENPSKDKQPEYTCMTMGAPACLTFYT
jgi:hypothetical protein